MRSQTRAVIGSVVGVGVLMILILGFHLGGDGLLHVGRYAQLLGAFIGGTLALLSATIRLQPEETAAPWLGRERLAWMFIGCGCIVWGIGECFWRYYLSLGQNPFPSLADLGYSSLPPLIFAGLILLPYSRGGQRRAFFVLDSLIAMGALLSIAWFLLLGSLAQTPAESGLAKVLGLYYPTADVALLSCTVFLLMRGPDRLYQVSARRISLFVAVVGLCVFATSDFIFNVQQNLGTYVDGTWVDLGWPLGMMTIGVAAYLRRFLPATSDEALEQRLEQHTEQLRIGPAQALPYLLLVVLFYVLIFNVLSGDSTQRGIRPVLVAATIIVVGLVLARQILTMLDNTLLVRKQTALLQEQERITQSIAERNATLEDGVTYLKEIQTRLANGDVHARARVMNGELWPLAVGLNLMADRMMRSEYGQRNAQMLGKAVSDFSLALEHTRGGRRPLVLPASCHGVPEIHRFLLALRLKPMPGTAQSTPPHPAPSGPRSAPMAPVPEAPAAAFHHQPSASPMTRRWKESIEQCQEDAFRFT